MFTMSGSSVTVTAKFKPYPEDPDFETPDFVLPEGLTEVEESAFEGISADIVYVPDSCSSIGDYAFSNLLSNRLEFLNPVTSKKMFLMGAVLFMSSV